MPDQKSADALLEGAYNIQTPEDNLSYYKDFAAIYDGSFADALGYVYPRIIADCYRAEAGVTDLPVADIGCGTGLVAAELSLPQNQIEGFDISPDMLATAQSKNIYAALHCVDLTQPLSQPAKFGAVVSAGTFTHGHLGPEPLQSLLSLAIPNALFVIGVNAQHFAAKRFQAVLTRMENAGQITPPKRKTVPIFSDPQSAHGTDEAQVLIYRKTA